MTEFVSQFEAVVHVLGRYEVLCHLDAAMKIEDLELNTLTIELCYFLIVNSPDGGLQRG